MVPKLHGLGTILAFRNQAHYGHTAYVGFPLDLPRPHRVAADRVVPFSGWYLANRPMCKYGNSISVPCRCSERSQVSLGSGQPPWVSTEWSACQRVFMFVDFHASIWS